MVLKKLEDGNGGKWVIKKKFTFALLAFIVTSAFAAKGVHVADTPEQLVVVLGAFGTAVNFILGMVFAADVVDKKLNNGAYE